MRKKERADKDQRVFSTKLELRLLYPLTLLDRIHFSLNSRNILE